MGPSYWKLFSALAPITVQLGQGSKRTPIMPLGRAYCCQIGAGRVGVGHNYGAKMGEICTRAPHDLDHDMGSRNRAIKGWPPCGLGCAALGRLSACRSPSRLVKPHLRVALLCLASLAK